MTGLKLFQMATMVLFASYKMTLMAQPLLADIGDISELNGLAQIVRNAEVNTAKLKLGIQTNDEAITTNGRMAIKFLDDSTVKLTEHSQLLIDEYIYDIDPSKSKMALTFALGTTRFITGNLNRIDKQNIKLKTPTANIAIRGTDFTATVDELGRSLVILLPDALGLSSGEIEVITATGSVILNKPFEATTVSVFESSPSKPAILDLTLNDIDNLLIVTPPEEKEIIEEVVYTNATDSILDFNGLDYDPLSEDFLKDDDLEFTELDIDYLADGNFLEDVLDVLDALAVKEEEDQLQIATALNITGTKVGQDTETGIITLVQGEIVKMQRISNQANVKLDLGTDGSYTVILVQNGVSRVVKINGGSSNVITIRQES